MWNLKQAFKELLADIAPMILQIYKGLVFFLIVPLRVC